MIRCHEWRIRPFCIGISRWMIQRSDRRYWALYRPLIIFLQVSQSTLTFLGTSIERDHIKLVRGLITSLWLLYFAHKIIGFLPSIALELATHEFEQFSLKYFIGFLVYYVLNSGPCYFVSNVYFFHVHDFIALFDIVGLCTYGIFPADPLVFPIDRHEVEASVEQELLFVLGTGVHYAPGLFVHFEHPQEFFTGHHVCFGVVLDAFDSWCVWSFEHNIFVAEKLRFSDHGHPNFGSWIPISQPTNDRSGDALHHLFL